MRVLAAHVIVLLILVLQTTPATFLVNSGFMCYSRKEKAASHPQLRGWRHCLHRQSFPMESEHGGVLTRMLSAAYSFDRALVSVRPAAREIEVGIDLAPGCLALEIVMLMMRLPPYLRMCGTVRFADAFSTASDDGDFVFQS